MFWSKLKIELRKPPFKLKIDLSDRTQKTPLNFIAICFRKVFKKFSANCETRIIKKIDTVTLVCFNFYRFEARFYKRNCMNFYLKLDSFEAGKCVKMRLINLKSFAQG